MSKATVMVMAGGTGGHIFPALAVARELQAAGYDVVWLGADGGMETRIVPPTGIALETIAIKGVRGNGIKRKLMLPLTLASSWPTTGVRARVPWPLAAITPSSTAGT